MSRRMLSTGRWILFLFVGGLSIGCGTFSHRTTALEDAELDAITRTPDRADVTATPSRRSWRSPELQEDQDFPDGQVALTGAEEAVDESRDPATEPTQDPTTDPPAVTDATRSPGTVAEIGTSSFETEVIESDRPVLVDFYADWCGPCKQLAPVLDELAADTPDVKVVKVNIDESRKLAKAYQVQSVPTLMVFKQGAMVTQHRGVASRKALEELLAR